MTTIATSLAEQLRAVLDGPRGWVRDEVRAVLEREEHAPVIDLPDADYREEVLRRLRDLAAERRGTAVGFPTSVGGEDDIGSYVTAFETLAMGDLSVLVKAGVQFGLFGGAVQHLGTDRHHRELLPDVITGDLLGCFAMTETGHGSNVQAIRTTATYDPATAEFVIDTPDRSAWKDYIGNAAAHGHTAVVFAQLRTPHDADGRVDEHGVHAFVVPIRDRRTGATLPGITVDDDGHKAGLNGVDNGRLAFDGVRVPREALLDRFASVAADGTYTSSIEGSTKRFFTTLGTLVQGRISVAGGALGATRRALAIAVRYGEQRRQFGPPDAEHEVRLLDYQVHRRKLLPAIATTYALQAVQDEDVDELHRVFSLGEGDERDQRRLEARAAGVKAIATWHATATIQMCREACGGAGYLAVNLLPQLKADTDVFSTFEGDNTVLLQLVAKGLLTDYRDEVGSLDALGTARYVADLVGDLVVERTSVRQVLQVILDRLPRSDDESSDLLDAGTHLALVRFREEHVLDGVARRLRQGIEAGGDPFDVFNDCQHHVVTAARAHVDRLVLEAFTARVCELSEGEVRDLLERVRALHALASLEEQRAWYLEHGRLSASRAKRITALVDQLCAELAPHARTLVDAFGVPERQLSAPIAQPGAGYDAS